MYGFGGYLGNSVRIFSLMIENELPLVILDSFKKFLSHFSQTAVLILSLPTYIFYFLQIDSKIKQKLKFLPCHLTKFSGYFCK